MIERIGGVPSIGRRMALTCLLAMATFTAGAAVPPEAQRGFDWLSAQVQEDGSVSGESASIAVPHQTRSETLDTLSSLGADRPALAATVAAGTSLTTEALSRQVIALHRAGGDVTSAFSALRVLQNPDGGFGDAAGASSNALDTAWALLAYRAANVNDLDALQRALGYLVGTINTDGGMAAPAGASQVYVTSYGLLALLAYRHAYDLTAAITKTFDWLKARRDGTGAYGEIMLDAVASLALATASTDSSSYVGALESLKREQSASGGWRDDPFLTALAIRALVGVEPPPPVGTAGSVTGTVIDAVSRNPLDGVTVSIGGQQQASGADGVFSIGEIPAGTHTLLVNKNGYAGAELSVAITAGTMTSVGTVALNPEPDTAVLRGQITQAVTGVPLGGASISVSVDGSLAGSATTAGDGAYLISGLPPGSAAITVSLSGFRPVNASVQFVAGYSYVLSPAMYVDDEEVPTTASLRAQIVDASDGAPIPDATLTLADRTAVSDASGAVELTGLATGDVAGQVQATGYQGVEFNTVLGAGLNQLGSIRLSAMAATVTVSGVIADATSGAPIPGALVSVQGLSLDATTDALGRYRIEGIDQRVFNLVAESAGYIGQTLSMSVFEFGSYTANMHLARSHAAGIELEVSTNLGAYDPFAEIEILGRATNLTDQDRGLVFIATVLDANRNVVEELQVVQLVLGQSPMEAIKTVPAEGTLEVMTRWYNLGASAGNYTVVMRAIEPDGRVVAEAAAPFAINAKRGISGGITLDPPITQAGTGQAVTVTADVANHGNLPVPPTTLSMEVILQTPDTSVPSMSPTSMEALAQGAPIDDPAAPALDAAGNLYFINKRSTDRRVFRRAPDGSLTLIGTLPVALTPVDLALGADGTVWVLASDNTIYGFRPDGSTLSRPTGLTLSRSLALDAQGNFLVTTGSVALARVSPTGEATILARNGLSGPVDAVAEGDGLLVSNYLDNTISRVSADGALTPAYEGLSRPQGLARDAQGNLYVANSGTNSIVRIDADGIANTYATDIPSPAFLGLMDTGDLLATSGNTVYRVTQDGAVSAFARGGVHAPRALLYEPDGNLLVANDSGALARVAPDGAVSHLTTSLSNPRGMARGPDGAVYIANLNGSIGRFVDDTYAVHLSGFTTPSGLAFDDAGTLYVAESSASRVTRVESSGVRSTLIQSFISNPKQPLVRADGTLFIANLSSVAVVEPGQKGRVIASGLGNVTSATLNADGALYVLLSGAYIERIEDSGARTRLVTRSGLLHIAGGEPGEMFYADTSRRIVRLDLVTGETETLATLPYWINGLARASDGTLYAAATGRVFRIADGAATQILQYGSTGTIAVDMADNLYIFTSNRVDRMSPGGAVSTLISGASGVSGIGIAPDGSVHLASIGASVVNEYSPDGVYRTNLAGFANLSGVEWAWGRLIISGMSPQGIYDFRPDGNPRLISTARAQALEWDGTHLYASLGNSFYRLDEDGTATTVFRSTGSDILGMASQPDGSLALAYSNDHRVLVVDAAYNLVSTIPGLITAAGVASAADGHVYVAEQATQSLLRFTAEGRQPTIVAKLATTPYGVAAGADGNLYVSGANGTLYRVTPEGVVTSVASASGVSVPRGVTFLDGSPVMVDHRGYLLRTIGTDLSIFAVGLGDGKGVRVAPDGGIYIAGGSSGAITRFADGALFPFASGLPSPEHLGFGLDGDVLVTGSASLHRVAADGQVSDLGFGKLLGGASLGGIAVEPSGASVVLASIAADTLYLGTFSRPQTVPPAGTVVHAATQSVTGLPVGEGTVGADFGSFVPPFGGDYLVRVTAPGIDGTLLNHLHVGPHARASLNAAPSSVGPGTASVALQAHLAGADFVSQSRIDIGNLKRVASSTRPLAMGADPQGNILYTETSGLKQIDPAGQVTTRLAAGLRSRGTVPVDSASNAYVVDASNRLLRVAPDGTSQVVTQFQPVGSYVISHVMDSHERIIAWLADRRLIRVDANGEQTELLRVNSGIPYALTIDGKDNLYLLDIVNTLYRLDTQNRLTVYLTEPRFEYEGMPIAGDCADNLLAAPFHWPRVNQNGEEYTLVQIFGRNGDVAALLNGLSTQPRLSDMDHLVYDRFAGRLLIWTDIDGSPIYSIPVTCGAISTDLHIVLPEGQPASGFMPAPDATLSRPDGATEYVWTLADVDALGRDVRFDTTLSGLSLGERRPVADEAFLVFRNSFSPDDIRLPVVVPEVNVAGVLDVGVTTDRTAYPANTDVLGTITVTNPLDAPVTGRLVVSVMGDDGTQVVQLADELLTLDPNSQTLRNPPFNTGSYFAGGYRIEASFVDAAGYLQGEAETPFDILGGTSADGTPSIGATVTTDKAVYNALDTVSVQDRVRSTADNYLYENLTATVVITDPDGTVVFTGYHGMTQLLPGAMADGAFVHRLNGAAVGSFTATVTVTDGYGRVLAEATSTFEVQDAPGSSLSGTVSVAHAEIEPGQRQSCTDIMTNLTPRPLENIAVSQALIRLDTDQVVTESTVTIGVGGHEQKTFDRDIATATLAAGDYACTLSATVAGQSRPLGHAIFKVRRPPIRLDGTLEIGDNGRVLILLDGESLPASIARTEPDAEAQRAFLAQLLTGSALPHTIVTDPAAFARELRSGTYSVYAVFAEHAKLDEQVQKELREAVYRGEGLVDAGSHDQRHQKFDPALGTRYLGKHAEVVGIDLFGESVPPGYLPLNLKGKKALRAQLDGADEQGRYVGVESADAAAVTAYTFGDGRSIYIGFDLLAEATLAGNDSLAATLLRQALAYVLPDYAELGAGHVVPLRLTVDNLGIATSGRALLALPPGIEVIDSGAGDVAGDRIVWTFDLAVGGQQTYSLWLRLPAGPVTLAALIQSGNGPDYIDQAEVTLNLNPQTLSGLSDARTLAASDGAFKQVRHWLDKAEASLDAGDVSRALFELTQAADEAARVDHPRTPELRRMIGQALHDAGRSL